MGANKVPEEVTPTVESLIKLYHSAEVTDQLVATRGLNSFLTGFRTRGNRKSIEALNTLLAASGGETLEVIWEPLLEQVKATEGIGSLSQAALPLLVYAPAEEAVPVLMDLFESTTDQGLKIQILDILSAYAGTEPVASLLDLYETSSPQVRRGMLAYLLNDHDRILLLFDSIEKKTIQAAELDANQKKRLLEHADNDIKSRAAELVASKVSADRTAVIEKYKSALEHDADALRGKKVFMQVCSSCHQVGDVGVQVAPDISDSRVRKPIQYLTDILDPNRAVDNNYFSYTILTTEGQIHTGIIVSETSTSLVLKKPEGKEVSLLRDDIELIKADGISLMPNGLEQNINIEQMADLISFLKNWRYLDGQIPIDANQPLN
ncbi:MAG: c-type cytochrome [Planctomycetaceae bacterium]